MAISGHTTVPGGQQGEGKAAEHLVKGTIVAMLAGCQQHRECPEPLTPCHVCKMWTRTTGTARQHLHRI